MQRLEASDLHQALDRVFTGDDADQVLLRINHCGQAETRGPQTLNDSIGGLALTGDDNSPRVIGERLARRFVEQDIEDVHDSHRLAL